MIERILVAANDSPAGLAAVRAAVDLARRYTAMLRVVHVLGDSETTTELLGVSAPRVLERRREAVRSLMHHVTSLADHADVEIETIELDGEPAHRILEQARSWPADLVVVGRADHHDAGGPWVGRETRMVLEFADQPVLVVPSGPGARH